MHTAVSTSPSRILASVARLALALLLAALAPACGGSESLPNTPPDGSVPDQDADDASSPDAGTPNLPGGRANFVASLMGAKYNGAWARMGTWTFSEDGTITESYWRWDQTQAPSPDNAMTFRAPTGYRTVGCPKVCDVWTTKGFEPGTSPQQRTGTWTFDPNGRVRVDWPDGRYERYEVVEHGSYVELRLVQHDYPGVSTVYGAVFGSHASLSTAATMADVYKVGQLRFELHEQNWDATTVSKTVTMFMNQYTLCAGSACIEGGNPAVYHTYFAGDRAKDGRKTFWYHQLTSVALTDTCANIDRGGHTAQLLQIIDDNGGFVGWVGAETSLLGKRNGASIVAHIRMVKP